MKLLAWLSIVFFYSISVVASTDRKIDGKTITVGSPSVVVTFPTTTQTLCGITQSCTLTNKTLTSPTINGADINFGTASNSSRVVLPKDTTTNLSSLSNTEALLAYDTTLGKVVYNSGSGWSTIVISDFLESNTAITSWGASANVWANLTSLSITPGVWTICFYASMRFAASSSTWYIGISTASGNTSPGSQGIDTMAQGGSGSLDASISMCKPGVTVASTTTYYCKGMYNITGGNLGGRCYAVRTK